MAAPLLLTVSLGAVADEYCDSYEAIIHLEGPTPFGPLNGGASLTIGDYVPVQALVGTVLRGSAAFDPTACFVQAKQASEILLPPGADGGIHIITGVDRVSGVAVAPGVFEVMGRTRITGGVGEYEDASGSADSEGTATVDLATGFTQLDVVALGEICREDDSDDDSDGDSDSD